jgi:Mitochondrial domain of unknown function (DUF1713)
VPRIDQAHGNRYRNATLSLFIQKNSSCGGAEFTSNDRGPSQKAWGNSLVFATEVLAGRYRFRTMGSLIKKRRKRMRKKKHKKMLKRTRFQRRAKKK